VPLRVVRLRLIEQGLLKDVPVASSPRHAAREAVSNVVSIPAPTTPPRSNVRPTLSVVPASEEEPSTNDASAPNASHYCSTAEFVALTGLSSSALHQLHALGVLAPVKMGTDLVFSEADVRVATAANALLGRGLDIRLLGSVRRVAEREIGLIEDLSAPLRSRGADSRAIRCRVSPPNWLAKWRRCARCSTSARCRTTRSLVVKNLRVAV